MSLVLLGLGLVAGCGRDSKSRELDVVAKVGGVVLTRSEVDAELDRRARAGLPALDPAEWVESWVRQQVLLTRAREAGVERDPEVRRRIDRVLVARMEEPLEEQLRSLESVKDSEVEAFYRTHAGEFIRPEQIRVAWIWFRLPPRATSEQRAELAKRVEHVRAEAAAGGAGDEAFARLARQYSEDRATRYTGGDCGWVSRTDAGLNWPAAARTAVLALESPGDVSPVTESEDGFHLFRLLARRAAEPRRLAELREQIVHRLQRERRESAVRQFHESLRAGLEIQVNTSAIAAVKTPVPILARQATPPVLPGH